MMRRASSYPESFTLWIHSVLRIEKKFSAKALSYGLPRLDMDGVMSYDCVRRKYACDVYWKPWSLWSCSSAVTFSLFLASLIVLNTRLTFCSVPVLYATILLSNRSLMIDKYNTPCFVCIYEMSVTHF